MPTPVPAATATIETIETTTTRTNHYMARLVSERADEPVVAVNRVFTAASLSRNHVATLSCWRALNPARCERSLDAGTRLGSPTQKSPWLVARGEPSLGSESFGTIADACAARLGAVRAAVNRPR